MAGHDFVFHLAANADVRFGTDHPRRDLEQNTIATHNVLEAMRPAGVKQIAFSSTGSVYGEPEVFPTPENCPFPVQTSLYAATKLAGEALIQAYCRRLRLPRAASSASSRSSASATRTAMSSTSIQQAPRRPDRIEVLGDGTQRKSYLYVQDCIDAMLTAIGARRGAGQHLQPRRRRILHGQRLARLDLPDDWASAPQRHYTGGPRLDRRQPVHLPRHRPHPLARLAAEAHDPPGRASGRVEYLQRNPGCWIPSGTACLTRSDSVRQASNGHAANWTTIALVTGTSPAGWERRSPALAGAGATSALVARDAAACWTAVATRADCAACDRSESSGPDRRPGGSEQPIGSSGRVDATSSAAWTSW